MKEKNDIAVVSMAGIFPGAPDINIFWDNILNKKYAGKKVPESRWIAPDRAMLSKDPQPDKAFSHMACLVDDFSFDPSGLDIDPGLAMSLDPVHKMALSAGKKAWALCKNQKTDLSRVGVCLAAIALPTDSSSYLAREIPGKVFAARIFNEPYDFAKHLTRQAAISSKVTSLPAALIAKALGFGGGTMTLDAACASSIYAVKLACDELISKRADAMLAGGVSRPECLYTQVGFSQLQALSPSGICAPFDEKADGLVVGEGAGILVLKRLDDAIKSGDEIFAVIKGIGLSNDMRGNLLAPDTEGQMRAMRSAYRSAGWRPWDVQLIECHGAGTPVGDITEILSLISLWKEAGAKKGICPIGSVKSAIGHLLTAAGAAGMIKTLVAIKNNVLPPSLNFSRPPENSPLNDSPFRVQTMPESWEPENGKPRRAGVSAFGFGGINAHILFEEFSEIYAEKKSSISVAAHKKTDDPEKEHIAIVGMGVRIGNIKTLREFQEAVLNGRPIIGERPAKRWKQADHIAGHYLENKDLYGAYIDKISIQAGKFGIPPNEIPDILAQQLVMLKTAAMAMEDASLPLRKMRPEMGVVIGMGFDLEDTDFHLRWNLYNEVEKRKEVFGFDEQKALELFEKIKENCGKPLTAPRVLGSLGGIVASRIAREFKLGGPSYVVSCENASGIKALEIAAGSLASRETDIFLAGAVDMAGDVRNIVTRNFIKSYTRGEKIFSLDEKACCDLPAEGAVALVLKRFDDAIKDNDKIYAIIKSVGKATGGGIEKPGPSKEAYGLSIKRVFLHGKIGKKHNIGYIEAFGGADPHEDGTELSALYDFFPANGKKAALGALMPVTGNAEAASGLLALCKTALCLFNKIIPPVPNYTICQHSNILEKKFHVPVSPQFWMRNRKDGPRQALVSSMTWDGNVSHVIMEESGFLPESQTGTINIRPLGMEKPGLFTIAGNSVNELIDRLNTLKKHIKSYENKNMEMAAALWHREYKPDFEKKLGIAIVADMADKALKWIDQAKQAAVSNQPKKIAGPGGVCFFPRPLGPKGKIAFVYPGSGNHYVGMGRKLGVIWPEILLKMDMDTSELKSQMLPEYYMPWRISWKKGWEDEACAKIASDPMIMIFGQVVHGSLMTKVADRFGIRPDAVIGYSLGESAGFFATGAWPERGEMLKRMKKTDLFTTRLSGPCLCARRAWKIPENELFEWQVAMVNRPASLVRKVLEKWPFARLLIVNTPDECVIGGKKEHVKEIIKELGCDGIFLDGVVTVHCDAAIPAASDYKALHIFPTKEPAGIRYYSCALGRAHKLDSESAASSILNQALYGFDFPKTIERAWKDGVRIFLEMGPGASCKRMIDRILPQDEKHHSAISICAKGEDDYLTILKFLGTLFAERVYFDFDKIYGEDFRPFMPDFITKNKKTQRMIVIKMGEYQVEPVFIPKPQKSAGAENFPPSQKNFSGKIPEKYFRNFSSKTNSAHIFGPLIGPVTQGMNATAETHKKFLDFSARLMENYSKAFAYQAKLLERMVNSDKLNIQKDFSPKAHDHAPLQETPKTEEPLFSREMCMEFAIGSVGKVLGPEFAIVDTYPVRVRLPDEPLMLVDRIMSIEGEKCSLKSGKIITEHDVVPGAWYLDGGRAPVCISVEAGQADLFLCSYLGIDLAVKGKRAYRLLDAKVKFHRSLPVPGEVIRYEINIDKFVRQGETYMFFFRFEGTIDGRPLISMRDGCAGFFTEKEVKDSGGIILTSDEKKPAKGKKDFTGLVPMEIESYSDHAVEALRDGNAKSCFGPLFEGVKIPRSLCLPGGKMRLIDRVLHIDPNGGRFSLGIIRAQADIHPDDWFLTCHFVDDMVMPGTLMYECCAHALRIFLQRMGWILPKDGVCYEPAPGVESVLKCRGPVTPQTRQVVYEVEIKEIGYNPEPYVIADAMMYGDGNPIVRFTDMSMKMTGVSRHELENFWKLRQKQSTTIFDKKKLLAFCQGNPSEAFGEPYKIFDKERKIARLPRPPYFFMDRITKTEPDPWILKPDGWIEAEYEIPPGEWYFAADRNIAMPFCILLEIALQPCGWLAAYLGSALKSKTDLKFRNLGGSAILNENLFFDSGKLIMRTRMTRVSRAGGMIVENFDMEILNNGRMIYKGDTYFGFFSDQALMQQVGIQGAKDRAWKPVKEESGPYYVFYDEAPLSPDDEKISPCPYLAMPSSALRMIDRIDIYLPDGGPKGLGFIRGSKSVDPDEWFFKAHFYQDPVCPGSLGIESFIQLLKFFAIKRWNHLENTHRFEILTGEKHSWTYRGQIIQTNKKVEVDAFITEIREKPFPVIKANGFLKKDGLYIYEMKDFGIRLVPVKN